MLVPEDDEVASSRSVAGAGGGGRAGGKRMETSRKMNARDTYQR